MKTPGFVARCTALATIVTAATIAATIGACGGADSRDTDRTSLAANAPHDVMYFDSTALPAKVASTGGAGGAANGAEIFSRCAVCHQANGQGLAGAYPPLAGSEWLVNNPEVPIRIVLHGLQGPITVKGTSFNNAMTPFADQLSDAEIAAVISYERSSWGNSASAVTAAQVTAARTATKAQTAPWNPADLQPMINGK
ncbi:MAG: c-type cytochrome [Gemmatimonadaceae bacterium]